MEDVIQRQLMPGKANWTCVADYKLGFACLEPMPMSSWSPFSAFIFSIVVLFLALTKQVFEAYMSHPSSLYGRAYARLSERHRKDLVHRHMSMCMKVALLACALYPFMMLMTGHNFNTLYFKAFTIGDALLVSSNAYAAIYAFELCYRQGISSITWLHHGCLIFVAQLALSYANIPKQDTTIAMSLCLIWGFFSIFSETAPHATLILYRLYPTEHRMLFFAQRSASILSAFCTIVEVGIVGWVYIALYPRWNMRNKTITPILFLCFVCAQANNARAFWAMSERQRELMIKSREEIELAERGMDGNQRIDEEPASNVEAR